MPTPRSDIEIRPAQIRAQCDRILASRVFALSKRQSAFLDYVVDAALDGRKNKLKEYAIGVDVFEKDESFDPSTDSIVRVEASRLRAKLTEYYTGEGAEDPVKIEIPKGHYAPAFSLSDVAKTAPGAGAGGFRPWLGVGVAILVVVLGLAVYQMQRPPADSVENAQRLPRPSSVAVLPLRDFSTTPEDYLGDAMTDGLIASLAQVRALRVTSLTSVMRYKNTDTPIPEIGQTLGVAHIVEGSLIREGDRVRVTAQLIDVDVDEHIWSTTLDRPIPDLLSVLNEVATAIARANLQ